jgi:hypothetical protein
VSVQRPDNETGRLGIGGLPASAGPGATFDLGAPWQSASTAPGDFVRLLLDPSVLGQRSGLFECVRASCVNGSSLATVVMRAETGTVCDHRPGAFWSAGMIGQDFNEIIGPPGPVGPVGPQGPTGPQGPLSQFIWNQVAPAAVWTITHNLGRNPAAIAVYDTQVPPQPLIGEAVFLDPNDLEIHFSAALAGVAYLE